MLKIANQGKQEIFYATRDSAGFDICSTEAVVLQPGEWKLIGSGLSIIEDCGPQLLDISGNKIKVLPEIQIRPRSGLAYKHGITVLNTPSTIDADYRGEIRIMLINHSKNSFTINIGDRIAQGVCALVCQLPEIAVKDVTRGEGGFGSTGK